MCSCAHFTDKENDLSLIPRRRGGRERRRTSACLLSVFSSQPVLTGTFLWGKCFFAASSYTNTLATLCAWNPLACFVSTCKVDSGRPGLWQKQNAKLLHSVGALYDAPLSNAWEGRAKKKVGICCKAIPLRCMDRHFLACLQDSFLPGIQLHMEYGCYCIRGTQKAPISQKLKEQA